ncbi:MAG: ankyrin repeat domain-containing protein, partial [Treponema sp.]|nr:ankyrin repeat domain-containing protein [Treponema sp.]
MKNSSFFTALIMSVLSILLLLAVSCGSSPPPQEPSIWELLQSRDPNLRSFFLGEVDVNARDENGRTPLHYAAEFRDAQLAAFFISIGADPNALDYDMQTPLSISIQRNDQATARVIAAGGANLHLPVKDYYTIATLALSMGPGIFRSIITPTNIETVDSNRNTVLHLAATAGNIHIVRDILQITQQESRLIHTNNGLNKTPLDLALERPDSRNHIEIAELLILRGASSQNPIFSFLGPAVRTANFNIRRNEGLAPIHFAAMNGYTGIIAFLLEKNIDININSTSGSTALHEAVRIGNLEVIRMLINAGADVNARDGNNNTPLHLGTPPEVHTRVARLLLEAGAAPNLRDAHGDTPLHITIILNRHLEVINTFLLGGSDVHIRNMLGETPLHLA